MLKNLSEYLHDFITKRTDEIGSNVLMKDMDYRELLEANQTKYHEILKYVPEEGRQLLLEYEEKEQAQSALAVELMYKQGFIDGIYLSNRLLGKKSS